ncbi:threonine synthase [Deferribacter autotrophicus]|uniref:Threonine synthase n=1 Tax=Deferribacter autotrophicus TaxID=500465 RepID=A0A5A8F8M3_9BACT|nr:threonine synthase [Deferribacter autotrophicus]KAA0258683.1 threonine synthase [Deferribacter autotrophicus]
MKYMSTRGKVKGINFQDAVLMGLADDGGLLIPEEIPFMSINEIEALKDKSYQELALAIMKKYISDIGETTLEKIVFKSYEAFDDERVVPVIKLGDFYLSELFHGPTYAFKDVALQFLGNLFEYILDQRNDYLNIIGATSGDTGSAAIYGVRGKKGIKIFILHPKGRVSRMQELQMTTVLDDNVFNIAVEGTFDDCQYIVKEIFSDVEFKREHHLGSINSINWARVLAQIVYYFYSYFQTDAADSMSKVNIVVPTGNFGNILAGFYAKRMGLPINKLVIATNENNILYRFVKEGDYSIKNVVQTYSPSMDIQIASNFERFLFYLFEEDADKVRKSMEQLKVEKKIFFNDELMEKVREVFDATSTSNERNLEVIKEIYEKYKYIVDPHTACGIDAVLKLKNIYDEPFIAMSTAHPAKFIDSVVKAIGVKPEIPRGLRELEDKEKRVYELDANVNLVKKFIEKNL